MGEITIVRDFPSPLEGFSRTLRIFTPELYRRDPAARFGVLYMHDGQNVLAHPETAVFPSWSANLALEQALQRQRIGPWMIVGIDHSGVGRFEDYSPWPDPRQGVTGRGATYARFLIEHLKPYIDARFRTRPEAELTATAGASLGGLISLYLGLSHPEVFGRVAALSPSTMWCDDGLFRHWDRRGERPLRLYLDVGGRESMNYAQSVVAFHRHLSKLGYRDEDLRLVVDPEAPHHESAWERRLPAALEWLLGPAQRAGA